MRLPPFIGASHWFASENLSGTAVRSMNLLSVCSIGKLAAKDAGLED
jgi:hypothetical protein